MTDLPDDEVELVCDEEYDPEVVGWIEHDEWVHFQPTDIVDVKGDRL